MEIKPIETHYAGCRFRSRLEARWAVVFDHLDIQWRYELQGYEIPGGGRYLPDFWLPTLALWVEVKGRFRDGEWGELLRAVQSGIPADPDDPRPPGGARLLLLGELPSRGTEFVAVHPVLIGRPDGVEQRYITLGRDVFCFWGHSYAAESISYPDALLEESYIAASAGDAYQAGRSARFEFGESG